MVPFEKIGSSEDTTADFKGKEGNLAWRSLRLDHWNPEAVRGRRDTYSSTARRNCGDNTNLKNAVPFFKKRRIEEQSGDIHDLWVLRGERTRAA